MTVGVAWCTYFERTGWQRLQYRRLRYAYRAPSYFLQGMLATGNSARFVRFDDSLVKNDLAGHGSPASQLDILYVSSHGMTTQAGYSVALTSADLALMSSGFGDFGPAIVVFDTCHLVESVSKTMMESWRTAAVGPSLRLILGFSSPATVSPRTSLRGLAFAKALSQMPVSAAWFSSIQETRYLGTDHPIAIAFADDDKEAERILHTAKIDDFLLLGPRKQTMPGIDWGPK